jgi:hypothetical protein
MHSELHQKTKGFTNIRKRRSPVHFLARIVSEKS